MRNKEKKIVELHPKSNIWRNVKIIICFLLICAAGALLYALRGDFSVSGIKQLAGYLDFADKGFSETELEVELERGRTAVVKPFKKGFAVVTEDSIKYINGKNQTAVDEYAVFSSPMLLTADKMFFAYDQGGKQYVLANNAAVLKNGRTDGDIISAAINDKGYYALVTDNPDCRGTLSMYDNKQQPICTWLTSTYYLSTSAVSPNGRYAAVSCLSESGGNFMSSVSVIDSQSTESGNNADAVINVGSEYILAISFLNDNSFYVITEGGAGLYSTDGEAKGQISFDGGIYAFASDEGNVPVIAANNYETDKMFLYTLNNKCEIENHAEIPKNVNFVDTTGNHIIAATDTDVYIFNAKAEKEADEAKVSGLKDISLSKDGNIVCVFSEKAEILKLG